MHFDMKYFLIFISFALLTLVYRGKLDRTPELFIFLFAIGDHLLRMKFIFIAINTRDFISK